jgi:hypothetical protein
VRLKWHAPPEDAADLTQGFFCGRSKDFFAGFDPSPREIPHLPAHLLDGFVANSRQAEARLKRGGGVA